MPSSSPPRSTPTLSPARRRSPPRRRRRGRSSRGWPRSARASAASDGPTMRPILDTNRLDEAEAELGMRCEQLLTPLTRYHPARPTEPFAIDNGAFSGFDERAFVSLLERERPRRHLCRFAEGPAMALENGHERFCG